MIYLFEFIIAISTLYLLTVQSTIDLNRDSEISDTSIYQDLKKTDCRIPNQSDKGECVAVSECQEYLHLKSASNVTSETVNFLKRIQCNHYWDIHPRVCCPHKNSTYEIPKIEFLRDERRMRAEEFAKNQAKKRRRRPGTITKGHLGHSLQDECGKQLVNRIYGGEIAELDEYPWMALLLYNSNEFGCAGALISRQYVLTAAHCVSGRTVNDRRGLKLVRLGEYNTNTEPDCIQEISHIDCADSAVDVGVERITIHPEYDLKAKDMQHDIALLKLKRTIRFTYYIMPICLPAKNNSTVFPDDTIFTVAGWGRTNLFNKFRWNMVSPIKLKLHVPLVNRGNCSSILKPYGVKLSSKQICAGGENSKDTCLGDSGGPLMKFDEKSLRWVAHGIVSYGFTECGVKGYPAVYTNVGEYLHWIYGTLE